MRLFPARCANISLACALLLAWLAAGCSYMGIQNPFANDPLTGGVDAASSSLLNVRLPAGFQRYPSHGYTANGQNGEKEGLETLRGNVDENYVIHAMFNTLKADGWQLRMALRKGSQAFYLYQKGNDYAAVVFRPQGLLTIMEIWRQGALPDGYEMPYTRLPAPQPETSIAGEEYGPLNENEPERSPDSAPVEERWGGSLEEREL